MRRRTVSGSQSFPIRFHPFVSIRSFPSVRFHPFVSIRSFPSVRFHPFVSVRACNSLLLCFLHSATHDALQLLVLALPDLGLGLLLLHLKLVGVVGSLELLLQSLDFLALLLFFRVVLELGNGSILEGFKVGVQALDAVLELAYVSKSRRDSKSGRRSLRRGLAVCLRLRQFRRI
jgi:hypothetical protein